MKVSFKPGTKLKLVYEAPFSLPGGLVLTFKGMYNEDYAIVEEYSKVAFRLEFLEEVKTDE